jgi:ribosomal protein S15P/S13E
MATKKTVENKEKIEEPIEATKKISQEEFEKKVLELAEKGLTSEKIGENLRRQGIHSKEYNKKISKILGKNYKSPDFTNVTNKLEKIKKHYAKNAQDKRAMREKDRIFSQIRKMKKYLKISE